MRRLRRLALSVLLGFAILPIAVRGENSPANAGKPADARGSGVARVMLVLDASGSMWGRIEGRSKIEIARESIAELLGGLGPRFEIGLVAYGHRREADCQDIETLVPVGPFDRARLLDAVGGIRPKGKTPIASALERAARDLGRGEGPVIVTLISDGEETCGRDPCAVATRLASEGVDLTAHVIGFDLAAREGAQLACIANATGGLFVRAENASELVTALGSVFQEAALAGVPGVWIGAALADDRQPLDEPVDWRIFRIGRSGQAGGEPVLERSAPTLSPKLASGHYRLIARYRGVEAQKEFDVDEAVRTHVIVGFDAGRLQLSAGWGKRDEMLYSGLDWEVQRLDGEGGVAAGEPRRSSGASEVFILPAGRYRVRSHYRDSELERELEIGAGQSVATHLRFGAGKLALRAVLRAGARPIRDPVHWEIRRVGKSGHGEDPPAAERDAPICLLTLESGRYEVSVRYGSTVVVEAIDLHAGGTQSHTIDLAAGEANVYAALPPPGGSIREPVQWQVFALSNDQHRVPREVAHELSSAQSFVLPAGRYRISGRWGERSGDGLVEVIAGESHSLRVVLH